ncbi:hypothetical protein QO034_10845 [Sedimentitalea sp. JM2-8]|uniref:Uncharacterized protein n=2 Tax=Sedimentitalea xiamensis TaxID=3050037 RepID=A0ABT7FER0_9RHOB|nr:hypothetical protein [Sedimentitalea xiamensis]
MALTESQRDFVEIFVLGRSAPIDTGGDDPLAVWNSAKESTDAGISALQAAIRSYKHPDLDNIADAGLNGVTEGNQTAMMRALMEFRGAAPADRAKKAVALVQQVDAYRGFLDSNRVIALCERNPFGVSVPIRAQLGAALDRIAAIAAR